MNQSKGIILVLLTAIISGISIFLNAFAVKGFNPFVFTGMKNLIVAVFLISLIVLSGQLNSLKNLTRKQWLNLSLIGLIGGSVPFLLYFYALKLTTASTAGFLHKTLFVWASLLAFFFLKEKLSKKLIAGAILLLTGNFLLFNQTFSFGFPELLVLTAVLFWAGENILSKNALNELSGTVVAGARMFFGSLFILLFLLFSGQLSLIATHSIDQWSWILLTAFLLFFYVLTYYSGLKHISVSAATSILLLGQPITALLSFVFFGQAVSLTEAFGLIMIVFGVLIIAGFSFFLNALKFLGFSFVSKKN
ncbi:DMT family transporter [Candidatus Micrarchaeota archaeon]|nr:DMT family transporter [Candidatus Micrarchaeota archaeon]MBU2476324.1 DMT family transporter [Candidatus Micrarchaeota archaeon]